MRPVRRPAAARIDSSRIGGAGLAVGAGDADQRQLVGGVAEEERGERRETLARVAHHHGGAAPQVDAGRHALDHDGRGAEVDRLLQMVVAVDLRRRAARRRDRPARRRASRSRCRGSACRRRASPSKRSGAPLGRQTGEQRAEAHQPSPPCSAKRTRNRVRPPGRTVPGSGSCATARPRPKTSSSTGARATTRFTSIDGEPVQIGDQQAAVLLRDVVVDRSVAVPRRSRRSSPPACAAPAHRASRRAAMRVGGVGASSGSVGMPSCVRIDAGDAREDRRRDGAAGVDAVRLVDADRDRDARRVERREPDEPRDVLVVRVVTAFELLRRAGLAADAHAARAARACRCRLRRCTTPSIISRIAAAVCGRHGAARLRPAAPSPTRRRDGGDRARCAARSRRRRCRARPSPRRAAAR